MKKSHIRIYAYFVPITLLIVLMVSACSSSGSKSASVSFPAGTYIPPVQRTAGIEMVFSEDGSFVMSGPQFTPIKGKYTVDKDKIVITETDAGPCANIPGTYTWKSDSESLTLVVVDDQCSIRRIDWQAGPWKKKQ